MTFDETLNKIHASNNADAIKAANKINAHLAEEWRYLGGETQGCLATQSMAKDALDLIIEFYGI